MRVLVAQNKARPLFPEVWKDSNPAIQLLKETIEDSWDHDGEARLTTFTVLERISELSELWSRYKLNHQRNNTNNNSNKIAKNYFSSINNHHIVRNNVTTVFRTNNDFSTVPSNLPTESLLDNSTPKNIKNDNVRSNQQPMQKIQPHQGRNPCLERNFHSKPLNEEEENKPLIEKSVKDKRPSPSSGEYQQSESERQRMISLRSFPAAPIPYVQNDLLAEEEDEILNDRTHFHDLIKKESNVPSSKNHIKLLSSKLSSSKKKNKKSDNQIVFLDSSTTSHVNAGEEDDLSEVKSNLELAKQRQQH